MLAVSGYSGIGKSALIHEVHKPIASYNGRFYPENLTNSNVTFRTLLSKRL